MCPHTAMYVFFRCLGGAFVSRQFFLKYYIIYNMYTYKYIHIYIFMYSYIHIYLCVCVCVCVCVLQVPGRHLCFAPIFSNCRRISR
jgi:hypothetical protein